MADAVFDYSQIEDLISRLQDSSKNVEETINEILHGFGVEETKKTILSLPDFPQSNRKWKGKKKAAKNAQPFTEQKMNLAFIVRSKKSYNYLYFPDDGSNTEKHFGNQNFMGRGLEKSINPILDRIVASVVDDLV